MSPRSAGFSIEFGPNEDTVVVKPAWVGQGSNPRSSPPEIATSLLPVIDSAVKALLEVEEAYRVKQNKWYIYHRTDPSTVAKV